MSSAWPKVSFNEAPLQIIDGDRGKNYPKQDEFEEIGHCLFLNTGNVTKSGFSFGDCQFITEQKDNLLRKGKLTREDVIMTTRGTIGNVGYFNHHVPFENIRINSGMVIFRTDKEKLRPSFLYQYLRSEQFNKQVNSLRSGAAQPQLPIRDIKVIELPLPPVIVQEAISETIGKYDDLIENNKRRIELLEESARQLYKEWFVRFRFPGHEHVKIIDGVPEGWTSGVVSDFYKTSSGGTPSRKVPEYYTGNINWVKTQELDNGFIFETSEKITDDAIKKSSAKLFPENTVLVAMYGATIGQLGILAKESASNQACCALISNSEFSHYIHAYLFLSENKSGLIGRSKGAAQNNISQDIVKNYDMAMPTKPLMEQFIDYVDPIFSQIRILSLEISKSTSARDILLPKLMNGEIVV